MIQVGSDQHLYMMDCDKIYDEITTRRARLKAAAREVKAVQPETANEFFDILANYDIDACTLTMAERALFE